MPVDCARKPRDTAAAKPFLGYRPRLAYGTPDRLEASPASQYLVGGIHDPHTVGAFNLSRVVRRIDQIMMFHVRGQIRQLIVMESVGAVFNELYVRIVFLAA